MSKLVALDVAILPPADVGARAMAYSAGLPAEGTQGLRLDAEHLPHITLTQQFVREDELDTAFERIEAVVRDLEPPRVVATGGGKSGHTLSIAIERTPELLELHH